MPRNGSATALLQDSEWLTRLARGLCGDRELAEDVAQEAMLAAWQARGGVRGALRPWLVGVVRRLLANRRRAEVRRRRRERAHVPPADDATFGTAPATDEVVARAALQQDVVHEVMALDEPYRTAVLLRYFDDLSCREISARLDVPLETVRSRTKRGVLQLRERLDRRHGGRAAWLGPVAAAFGSGMETTSLGAVLMTAAMVMLVNVKILLVAALAAVFGLMYWLPDAQLAAPPAAAGEGPGGALGPAVAAATTESGSPSTDSDQPAADRIAAGDDHATLTGRVLWESSDEPAVLAEVQLIRAEPFDAGGGVGYTAAIDPDADVAPQRLMVRTRTDEAGHFEVEFGDVGSLAACQCIVRAEGAWSELSQVIRLNPSTSRDLGTLRLRAAVTIHGRVRDTTGEPVAATELHVLPRTAREVPDTWIVKGRGYPTVETDENGEFRMPRPLPTGEYFVSYSDRSLEAVNSNFVVTRDSAYLDLRVHRGADVLRGVVVDADGEPVEGLSVSSKDGRSSGKTAADGAFEVRRRRGAPATTELTVWRHRFHIAEVRHRTQEPIAWGREDVRIVLEPGADLVLQVVQAPTMQPVEDFDLQLHREGARQWMPGGLRSDSGSSGERHADGLLELGDLVPGRYRALVVQGRYSVFLPLDVPAGVRRQRLVLPPRAEIMVRVVGADGAPVADAACDLFLQPGELQHLAGIDLLGDRAGKAGGGATQLPFAGRFLRAAGGATDANGRLGLPPPSTLGIRATGRLRVVAAGYAPQVVEVGGPVAGGDLTVELQAGATVRGTLTNATFTRESAKAYVFLRSRRDPRVWFPRRIAWSGKAAAFVRPDGSFELEGVPVEGWQVWLGFLTPGRTGAMIYQSLPVGDLNGLEDGAVRTVQLDGAGAAPVRVTGTALLAGRAVPHVRLDFSSRQGARRAHGIADGDEYGRFATEMPPGIYDVEAAFVDGQTGEHLAATGIGQVVVPASGPVEINVDLRTR